MDTMDGAVLILGFPFYNNPQSGTKFNSRITLFA
jgi:hypothetical protein